MSNVLLACVDKKRKLSWINMLMPVRTHSIKNPVLKKLNRVSSEV